MSRLRFRSGPALAVAALLLLAAPAGSEETPTIRVGCFPNLTHAPALIGRARGDFERALAPVKVEWRFFNAGPSAMEALFAREIDLTYIGPGPAVNGYVRSKGEAVRIISGVAEGGAALVARRGSGFTRPDQLAGRKIATPQLGNTQDIALRHWITDHGFKSSEHGGNVTVIPMPNADHLSLFLKKEIDASWTVEPWVSRLISEAGGEVLLEEREIWPDKRHATTVLVSRFAFHRQNTDLVRRWLSAQENVLAWMNQYPDSARALANAQLKELTGKALKDDVVKSAWARLTFSSEPAYDSILTGAGWAHDLGFLGRDRLDLRNLSDFRLLNVVRREHGLWEAR